MYKFFFCSTFFFMILGALSGCGSAKEDDLFFDDTITVAESLSREDPSEEDVIYVSIQGAVEKPGVYIMPAGSRVYELINRAGGVVGDADTTDINMVYEISDGMQITVPSRGMGEEITPLPAGVSESGGLVNINTATLDELMTLNGIGETRAKAILAYREKGIPFESPEDIMKVNGIKSGIYEGLKDQICVK